MDDSRRIRIGLEILGNVGDKERDETEWRYVVVWEGEARNPAIELFGIIGVFCDWTKVVDAIEIVMTLVEEATHIGSVIAVEGLDARGREAHDDDVVRHIGEIEIKIEERILKAGLLAADNTACDGGHVEVSRK